MINDDIKLARRISGGGTVYHDEGNLNYSIIEDNKTYNSNKIYKMILDALKNLNIRAQIKSQNSLFYNGKKFSGTAFAYKRSKVLHHGTLLLDSDLKKLNKPGPYFLGTFVNQHAGCIFGSPHFYTHFGCLYDVHTRCAARHRQFNKAKKQGPMVITELT